MRRPAQFLVWNPSRRLPTRGHETFEKAQAEAERLRIETDFGDAEGEFWVMAPVRSKTAASAAKAFSDGKAEGLAQAHAEIMLAEARSDAAGDAQREMRRRLGSLEDIGGNADEFQAIVADCLLWFDGFRSAFHLSEAGHPRTPDRDGLTRLNTALQAVLRSQRGDIEDEEIPF